MDKTMKIERLKKLIEGSAAFSQDDKLKLTAKIPELTDSEMDESIRVFEKEIEDWKEIYKRHEENKAMLFDYMDKSQHRLAQISREGVKTSERGQRATEEAESEELLKTI